MGLTLDREERKDGAGDVADEAVGGHGGSSVEGTVGID